MLLNKYGGRSFNDINQYPVFPWILKDYNSQELELNNPASYRPLKCTIGAITKEKRDSAQEKFETLYNNQTTRAFQFGTHYLPGRVALGYMVRLEPYASLLQHFDLHRELSNRIFHSIKTSWNASLNDISDNKELIPELFYLPEMFGNFNMYWFGYKTPEQGLLPEAVYKSLPNSQRAAVPLSELRVVVDQCVFPDWAKNSHDFIRLNRLALESLNTSLSLHFWIDLIFGFKQQDQKSFNLFKECCDEDMVKKQRATLERYLREEIQEFGTNPIKLFLEKHPERSKMTAESMVKYSIFRNAFPKGQNFALIKLGEFAVTDKIVSLEAYSSRLIVMKQSQSQTAIPSNQIQILRSTPEYLNSPHEKAMRFEKFAPLLPPIKLFPPISQPLGDAANLATTVSLGQIIISCRHYDNSISFTNILTNEILLRLYFHQSLVNSISATSDQSTLFTGSHDGILAKWDLKGILSKIKEGAFEMEESKEASPQKSQLRNTPLWYACDHEKPIISLDASSSLDLVATASLDDTIALRIISTGKLWLILRPEAHSRSGNYRFAMLRLAPSGYIVAILRSKRTSLKLPDIMLVYSMNGELIFQRETLDCIHALTTDELGYHIITGGTGGRLICYELLTGSVKEMFEDLDESLGSLGKILIELRSAEITSLVLTKEENCQQIIFGTSSGGLYSYKCSPRLTESAVYHSLKGLIVGS